MSRFEVPGVEFVRRLLALAQIDRPVFYGLASKLWLAAAGPVSALLVAALFSPELQGFYYTFSSLIALQVFVELGLGVVILHFASHEWASLSLDEHGWITGDRKSLSRLQSIARIAAKWYSVAAVVLVVILLGAGEYLFAAHTDSAIEWRTPWFVLCVLTGINIALTPAWSILEGCNQVSRLYGFRFLQTFVTGIAAWAAIALGAELWTGVITSTIGVTVAIWFVFSQYKNFFLTILQRPEEQQHLHWHKDMLPMQWRIAISWVSGYFAFSLFTPVLFKYQGPVVAGQMGMTWSLVGMVGLAGAWLSPKVPTYGMLVAQKSYTALDKLLWQTVRAVATAAVGIALMITLLVYVLEATHFFLSERILSIGPVMLFLVAQVLVTASLPFSAYLRAHKQEPLMWLSVVAALCVAMATVIAAKYAGPTSVAFGYFLVNLLVIPFVYLVWARKSKQWRVA